MLHGKYILQNDLRMRAALSHSFSIPVGQKASDPILLVILLTGPPSFSKAAHPLSNAALPLVFVFSQADAMFSFYCEFSDLETGSRGIRGIRSGLF